MANRFWVGGTGNWDISTTNWSATSGGAGGASLPTASDDVYFDANSGGGTVTVNTSNRACLSLNFRGLSGTSDYTGTLASSGTGSINIGGNLTFSPSMTITYTSFLNLFSTLANTITFNGRTFPGTLVVQGNGGSWVCQDIIRVRLLYINQGSFSTNFDLYADNIGSSAINLVKSFTVTTGSIYFTGAGTVMNINTTNLTYNADVDYYITDSSSTQKTLAVTTTYPTSKNIYLAGSGSGAFNLTIGAASVALLPSLIVTNTGGAGINFTISSGVASLTFQAGATAALVQTTLNRTLTIHKDLTFTSSQGAMSGSLVNINFTAASTGTANITLAGKSIVTTSNLTFNNASGVFNFLDAFSYTGTGALVLTAGTYNVYSTFFSTNLLSLQAGTLNCNGNNFTLFAFTSDTSSVRALNVGTNATWTITGSYSTVTFAFSITSVANMTATASNFTLIFTDTTTNTLRFIYQFPTLITTIYSNRGASTGTLLFGNVDINLPNFIDNGTAAHTVQFTQSRIFTFGHFYVKGSAGNVVTLNTNGSVSSFIKSPLGLVSCDYISVTGLNANPANTWYAGPNSTIVSGAGWITTDPPARKMGSGGVG